MAEFNDSQMTLTVSQRDEPLTL